MGMNIAREHLAEIKDTPVKDLTAWQITWLLNVASKAIEYVDSKEGQDYEGKRFDNYNALHEVLA